MTETERMAVSFSKININECTGCNTEKIKKCIIEKIENDKDTDLISWEKLKDEEKENLLFKF